MATTIDAFLLTYIVPANSAAYNAGVQTAVEAYIRNGRVAVAYTDAANQYAAFPASQGFADWKAGYNSTSGISG